MNLSNETLENHCLLAEIPRLRDIVSISDNFAFVRLPCKTLEIEMKISF